MGLGVRLGVTEGDSVGLNDDEGEGDGDTQFHPWRSFLLGLPISHFLTTQDARFALLNCLHFFYRGARFTKTSVRGARRASPESKITLNNATIRMRWRRVKCMIERDVV